MSELGTVLNAVVPVFLIVGGGFVMRRLDWLNAAADASLLRLTINVLIPCLIFDSLLGNQALTHAGNVILPPLVGFLTVGLGIAVARGCSRWIPDAGGGSRRTFAFCTAMYNYGYIPIPLAMGLFDRETVGVLFVHNLGVEVALWVFGLMLLAGAGLRTSGRRLLNAPLLTIASTLLLNLILPRDQFPTAVLNAAHLVGQCAIPVGMILIGATVADHVAGFHSAGGARTMALGSLLRLAVLPVLFLLVARWLPCSVELKRVILIQAAMPAAVFPIVMVRHYGGDPATALQVVMSTSILSLVTIPLWLHFGVRLAGLQ
ncbi:MAG: AEC family transporter [Verrucomicrobiae bacterium]|nr:AEC family transporter [Verrucomicrobiae bacterium]MCP5522104.1 AEC family transporter [Verrucomicrobiales bacterium]